MELSKLLEESGIRNAVVIDDVFDAVPRPDELDEADWSIFFDDLGPDGAKLLTELYPGYEDTSPDDLRITQEFISVVWENRNQQTITCDSLFSEYETTNATERTHLASLVTALENLSLACTTSGRQPDEKTKEADLIIVDLFLGYQQSEYDIDRAVDHVKELVEDRKQNPPLVVLMSRSSRLLTKRNNFRDNAGLLGSTFRFISKEDLAIPGKLETLLRRLAIHYEDAKRVAGFVNAWDASLDEARKNFIRILRRLDLPDLAQIRTLMLDFEGQMLGEYLLDIADRVLQHEIEAQSSTISASQELNKIDLEKYPAPHMTGTPDLQELVYRMLFQHEERQKLSSSDDTPRINFGDILRCKDERTGIVTKEVLLVVTPACDLVRSGTKHVLVISGDLTTLSARDWSYGTTITKTPIFISLDGSRSWIKWNLKDYRTIPLNIFCKLLRNEKGCVRIGRLREIYAIEIQQKMLAGMGRIGQPANPPATFPVSISLYVVSPEEKVLNFMVEGLDEAVYFVGRDEHSKRVDHLVLDEMACDALKYKIQNLSVDEVHPKARESLTAMKTDLDFFELFEKGLINVPLKNSSLQELKGKDNHIYMRIFRNDWLNETKPIRKNQQNSPLIMRICDISPNSET